MKELDVLTAAADQLRKAGTATLEYITAEFAPFSSQFRPDLVFRPSDMPEHVYFVEYRDLSSRIFQDSPDTICQQLIEHRDFISKEHGVTLHFAIASNGPNDLKLAAALKQYDVAYLAPMLTADSLAEAILNWAGNTRAVTL